jgi:hypothetical protein
MDGTLFEMATWDTDIVRNTTVTQIGGFSFEFVSGSTGEVQTDYIPVETGAPFRAVAFLQGTSVAAGNTAKVDVDWYTAAKASVSTSTVYATAVLPGTGAWFELPAVFTAPATAAFAKVSVEKVSEAGGAWTMYCDFAGIERHPYAFSAYLSADTTYATSSTLGFDTENYDYGSWYNTGTFQATVPIDGVYNFSAGSFIRNLNAGNNARMILDVTATATINGQRGYVHTNGDDLSLVLNVTRLFSRGDVIRIRILHDFGAVRTVNGTALGFEYTWFSGTKVE